MVNINIPIEDALHHRVKVQAVLAGTTLKAFIIDALNQRVTREQERLKPLQQQ